MAQQNTKDAGKAKRTPLTPQPVEADKANDPAYQHPTK